MTVGGRVGTISRLSKLQEKKTVLYDHLIWMRNNALESGKLEMENWKNGNTRKG